MEAVEGVAEFLAKELCVFKSGVHCALHVLFVYMHNVVATLDT